MIKLLTTEEHIVNPGKAIYVGNTLQFEDTELRGNSKQICFEFIEEADCIALQAAIKKLELEDYIQMAYDGKLVGLRVYVEEV